MLISIYGKTKTLYTYKINVFDSEISSESVIDMIRKLYKNG